MYSGSEISPPQKRKKNTVESEYICIQRKKYTQTDKQPLTSFAEEVHLLIKIRSAAFLIHSASPVYIKTFLFDCFYKTPEYDLI